ncbi:sigma factor [Streptomyces sp. NPDC048504]|uniref:sigma factor n=1 Tax=Streptomyces sp. NPDC048504 TaxID=3365559 RepID=UPI00371AADA1
MGRGAETALHAFVEGRRTALFRSAYLLCGNRDEAEDLVQTALVKVVLGARRHGRLDNLEAYARKTLVNTFIAGRRRFWRREQAYGEVPDAPGEEPAAGTGPESPVVDEEPAVGNAEGAVRGPRTAPSTRLPPGSLVHR